MLLSSTFERRSQDLRKGNSSRVSKGWENLRISYLLDSARFLVRRLGHLLVNPERDWKKVTKEWWRTIRRERGVFWKSPRRIITPPTSYYSPSLPHRAVLAFSRHPHSPCPSPPFPHPHIRSWSFPPSLLFSSLIFAICR